MKKRQIPFLFLTKGRSGLEKKWRHRLAKVIFCIMLIISFFSIIRDGEPYDKYNHINKYDFKVIFSDPSSNIKSIEDARPQNHKYTSNQLETVQQLSKEEMEFATKAKQAWYTKEETQVEILKNREESQQKYENEYTRLKNKYKKEYITNILRALLITYIVYLILQTLYYKVILYITHWKPKKIV